MSQQFKCFIQFNNNRYDIVINDNINSLSFNDIFPKIHKIFEIALNQKISFDSHLFEIYNEYYNKFLRITHFEKRENVKIVKNKSLIRVLLKNETNIDFNNRDINSNKCIETTNCVSNKDIITESESNSLNESNSNTINSSQTPSLESEVELNLDEESYKLYAKLLEVIELISENNCDLITDYEWRYDIHNKMISFGFSDSANYLWRMCFSKMFNKYLEILNKTSDLSMAINLFPFFENFNAMIFSPNNIHYNKVMQLRADFERKSKLNNESVLSKTICEQKNIESMRIYDKFLETNINEMKEFYLMVHIIQNIQHKYKPNHKYVILKEVSQIMIERGFHKYTENESRRIFDKWTQFYVEKQLLYGTQPKNKTVSYIFNLLKIIHSINLKLFYGKKSSFLKSLNKLNKVLQFDHNSCQNSSSSVKRVDPREEWSQLQEEKRNRLRQLLNKQQPSTNVANISYVGNTGCGLKRNFVELRTSDNISKKPKPLRWCENELIF